MGDSYGGDLVEAISPIVGSIPGAQQGHAISDRSWTGAYGKTARETGRFTSHESWSAVQERIRAIEFQDTRTIFQEIVERLIAGLALIVFAPIMLAVAIYIRLDSPGSPVFSHYRVGKRGKLFKFYKFRTLRADAKERFPEWYAYCYTEDQLDRLYFKIDKDPRVTRAGQFLRRSTLDELPNFWNVFKGDMTLVGPRPEIPEMLQYYRPEYLVKFCVKPGVTGLSQVSGRGHLLFRKTEELDAYSVRNRTMLGDIKMMLRTVYLIFTAHGAF